MGGVASARAPRFFQGFSRCRIAPRCGFSFSNQHGAVRCGYYFFEDRTVIVVAHRLSTVKKADQIIVLEDGQIKEIGNHSTLIAQQGTYFSLVSDQLELGGV